MRIRVEFTLSPAGALPVEELPLHSSWKMHPWLFGLAPTRANSISA
jgi:hypothetical protein